MSTAALLKAIEDQAEDLSRELHYRWAKTRLDRAPDESADDFKERVLAHSDFKHGRFQSMDKDGNPWYEISTDSRFSEQVMAVESVPISRLLESFIDRIKTYRKRADKEVGFDGGWNG